MEEDMERLRARRRAATHPHGRHVVGGALSSPSNSTFSMDSTNSTVILGLGTGVGIRDVLRAHFSIGVLNTSKIRK